MTKLKRIMAAVLVCALVLGLAGCGGNEAMVVNGESISQGIMDYYYNSGLSTLANYGIDTEGEDAAQYLAMMEEQAVAQATSMALIRSTAKKNNVEITTAEVDQLLADEKAYFTNDDDYDAWLEENGLTENDVKWILETQLYAEELYRVVNEGVTATDAELQAAYEANPDSYITIGVSHILVAVDSEASDADWAAAEETCANLIQQLNDGADFATLAQENSTDSTAANGGVLPGTFTKENSTYVAPFTEASFELENVGDFTQTPVRTDYGFHVIKLDSKVTGWENLRTTIEEDLLGETKDNNYYDLLDAEYEAMTIEKDYVRKHALPEEEVDTATDGADTATDGTDAATDGTDAAADGTDTATDGADTATDGADTAE